MRFYLFWCKQSLYREYNVGLAAEQMPVASLTVSVAKNKERY